VRHERLFKIAPRELSGNLPQVRSDQRPIGLIARVLRRDLDRAARPRQPEVVRRRVLIESHRARAARLQLCVLLQLREVLFVRHAGAAGYRQFPPSAVNRVLLVRNAMRFGFSLDQVAGFLAATQAVRRAGRCARPRPACSRTSSRRLPN
jgi:hypothetical protein